MLRLPQHALIAITLSLMASNTSLAQTITKLRPGETAAMDPVTAEKTAACTAQAKKLGLLQRRAWVKSCVSRALGK